MAFDSSHSSAQPENLALLDFIADAQANIQPDGTSLDEASQHPLASDRQRQADSVEYRDLALKQEELVAKYIDKSSDRQFESHIRQPFLSCLFVRGSKSQAPTNRE
ncbi:MAG: hypothetical protein K8F91_02355 [Candidatus Obscuribacterales bacterium]|nr:hypothetical protein [Candidatus Obscuribacterales bacterium]